MSEERQMPSNRQQQGEPTGRREALKQMGKYAAYTTPTLIALTLPGAAHAAKRRPVPRPHVSRR
jgi:hypothetical protein